MDKKDLLKILAMRTSVEVIDLESEEIDPDAIKLVGEKTARTYHLVPVRIEDDKLIVAIDDPTNFQAIDDLKIITGLTPVCRMALGESIDFYINKFYTNNDAVELAIQEFSGEDEAVEQTLEQNSADVDNAPIVRIVNSIMVDALNKGASDIHIEPFEKEIRIRIRVDGDLQELLKLQRSALSGIVTRIKIMSDLNIAETKKPQDGRIRLSINGKPVNMRISFIPTVFGEKIVIRLLNNSVGIMKRSELGLSEYNYEQVGKLMKISEGVILLTGPTGSGKTTTLYSLLAEFNTPDRNIVTLEDPVEYQIYGINQTQVNVKQGMTFAGGLRALLRQDPDIIMLGEIRDGETAEIAIRSAVTGHVVLSTLHTNDTVSSISRLVDMGIPKYMVTSSISGIIAQRLVKKICPRCGEAYYPGEEEKAILGITGISAKLKKGAGCPYCNGSGYKGRMAIHEVLVMSSDIKEMINSGCSAEEIKKHACSKGMKTLADSARELVLNGVITIDEMLKATYTLE